MVEDDMLLLLSKWKGGRLMGRGMVGIPVWVIWRCRWRASLGFDLFSDFSLTRSLHGSSTAHISMPDALFEPAELVLGGWEREPFRTL